jgi:hypothetical protein
MIVVTGVFGSLICSHGLLIAWRSVLKPWTKRRNLYIEAWKTNVQFSSPDRRNSAAVIDTHQGRSTWCLGLTNGSVRTLIRRELMSNCYIALFHGVIAVRQIADSILSASIHSDGTDFD